MIAESSNTIAPVTDIIPRTKFDSVLDSSLHPLRLMFLRSASDLLRLSASRRLASLRMSTFSVICNPPCTSLAPKPVLSGGLI